jgi:hypothetical protein
MSTMAVPPVTQELGLFGAIVLRGPEAAGLSPNPQSAIGGLALFFHGLSRVPFTATRYPHGTYPSFDPFPNWVCLARKRGSRDRGPGIRPLTPDPRNLIPVQIGFVSRSGASRRCHTIGNLAARMCPIRKRKIGFVWRGMVE